MQCMSEIHFKYNEQPAVRLLSRSPNRYLRNLSFSQKLVFSPTYGVKSHLIVIVSNYLIIRKVADAKL